MEKTIYQFKAKSISGNEVDFNEFKGKVMLVVNTASKCGFTPQYKGLENLYKKYKDKGLVILGFPCNQFREQEPLSEKEIAEGCLIKYDVSFPMFSKIEVNGDNTHPIYKYLKENKSGILGKKIKWNFTKFLVDKDGTPFKRYGPIVKPEYLENDIKKLLV